MNDEKAKILEETLLRNFKSPRVVTQHTPIQVGVNYFSQGNIESLSEQTGLVTQHRPQDLEAYFQGLLDAGVPAAAVEDQRSGNVPADPQR